MLKLVATTAAALVLGAVAAFADDPVYGRWQTEVDDGSYAHVDVADCSGKICGTFVRTFNSSGEYKSPNLGKKVIMDMEPDGENFYRGKVWRPSNDKIYIGKIDLDGDTLYLKGCVAGGLLCASQTWKRVQ
jgi:uncharacterized protein (DUF2147 family)